jgi:hypothetical protein
MMTEPFIDPLALGFILVIPYAKRGPSIKTFDIHSCTFLLPEDFFNKKTMTTADIHME